MLAALNLRAAGYVSRGLSPVAAQERATLDWRGYYDEKKIVAFPNWDGNLTSDAFVEVE